MNTYYRNYKMNIIIALSQKVVYLRNIEPMNTARTKGETIWPKKKYLDTKSLPKGEKERQTHRQRKQGRSCQLVINKFQKAT